MSNVNYIFKDQNEAYREMMTIAVEVIRDIVAAGEKPPPVGKMIKDIDKLWEVWKLFAPRGHYESPSRATQ